MTNEIILILVFIFVAERRAAGSRSVSWLRWFGSYFFLHQLLIDQALVMVITIARAYVCHLPYQ
jgi:hypothetical protein